MRWPWEWPAFSRSWLELEATSGSWNQMCGERRKPIWIWLDGGFSCGEVAIARIQRGDGEHRNTEGEPNWSRVGGKADSPGILGFSWVVG